MKMRATALKSELFLRDVFVRTIESPVCHRSDSVPCEMKFWHSKTVANQSVSQTTSSAPIHSIFRSLVQSFIHVIESFRVCYTQLLRLQLFLYSFVRSFIELLESFRDWRTHCKTLTNYPIPALQYFFHNPGVQLNWDTYHLQRSSAYRSTRVFSASKPNNYSRKHSQAVGNPTEQKKKSNCQSLRWSDCIHTRAWRRSSRDSFPCWMCWSRTCYRHSCRGTNSPNNNAAVCCKHSCSRAGWGQGSCSRDPREPSQASFRPRSWHTALWLSRDRSSVRSVRYSCKRPWVSFRQM